MAETRSSVWPNCRYSIRVPFPVRSRTSRGRRATYAEVWVPPPRDVNRRLLKTAGSRAAWHNAVSMATNRTERVHLSVAEARELSERAMRGIGYTSEEARILADHVIDAALCGYEYSGLPKLLNVADHPLFKAPRQPVRVVKETSVSVLFDGGNQSGMLGMYYATRAVIDRASTHGWALVGVNNLWMSGRSAYYVEMTARAGLIGIHTVAAPPMVA